MQRFMEQNNISVLQRAECCGCRACGDICPKQAISFATDAEGFFYPKVDENCINCGKCLGVCPAIHSGNEALAPDEIQYVGCLDNDKQRRDTGSSGGVFGLLASALIDEGYVVCGAAFDEDLQLKHTFADSEESLHLQKKSKYLQSDCSGTYKNIKRLLSAGTGVMFVGTPCQCKAVRNYFQGDGYENLLIVDFACHGVPSQDLFDKCIAYYENTHDCKVLSYSFRHKPKRYTSPQNFLLKISKRGKEQQKTGAYYEEPFYYGFQKYETLRPACYQCKWSNTDRPSDITLADFWGIETVTSKWDRRDTPSLVMLNTEKGRKFFLKIAHEMDVIDVTREDAVRVNGSLVAPTKMPVTRDQLFHDLATEPFDVVVKRHLTPNHKWMKDVYYAIPFLIRKLMLKTLRKL